MEKEPQNQVSHRNPDGSKIGKITQSIVGASCLVQANCTVHNSTLSGEAQIRNSAWIEASTMAGRVLIQGHSEIRNSTILDDARISGASYIQGATIKHHARVHGSSVYGKVEENAYVDGDSLVDASSIVRGNAYVCNIFLYRCRLEGDVAIKSVKTSKVRINHIYWWKNIP